MILIAWLICFAIILQTVEMFSLGPWPWEIVKGEIPRPLRPFLRNQLYLLFVRIAFLLPAAMWPENPLFVLPVLLITWLIAVRWRGTFNGGSDCMTVIILT